MKMKTRPWPAITFQNYFRMYDKLSGMTGTAETEAPEFKKIYDLDVLVIPTHRAMIRKDMADLIYKTQKEKYDAAIKEIIQLHRKGQPVLVGTISIDVSEDSEQTAQEKRACPTMCSTPNTTKRKQKSWPMPARKGR